jgi:hypothetical protein
MKSQYNASAVCVSLLSVLPSSLSSNLLQRGPRRLDYARVQTAASNVCTVV